MYNFILQIALMVSLAAMIYLVARAIPRVGDELTDVSEKNKLDDWLSSLPLHKLDASFNNFLEKFLRKMRLLILKLDNVVGSYLSRVKKMNGVSRNGEEKTTIFTKNNGSSAERSLSDEFLVGNNSEEPKS